MIVIRPMLLWLTFDTLHAICIPPYFRLEAEILEVLRPPCMVLVLLRAEEGRWSLFDWTESFEVSKADFCRFIHWPF